MPPCKLQRISRLGRRAGRQPADGFTPELGGCLRQHERCISILLAMKPPDGSDQDGSYRAGRDLLILAAGVLPAHILGLAWMREAGVPTTIYIQNLVALIAGAAIAVSGGAALCRRSPA